eukprot:GSChrysophyteH2.ASY1.ANO1.1544.1 assembled CDS
MSALTDRHRWCITKILETFGSELTSDAAQQFMRQEAVLSKFTGFFKGESSGRLFVFFQEESPFSESNGPKLLTVSDGNNGLMTKKCCYFVRNVSAGVPLDPAKIAEADLLYGELGDSPLGTIESMLSQSYRPMLDSYDSWGKVDEEQRSDFITEIGSFIVNINEALTSFAGGLELTYPDAKIIKAIEVKSNRTAIPVEAVNHFEGLLNEWCNQIERYLADTDKNVTDDDVGPRGELEKWRGRMQRLTSITEQLKRSDCKQVISVLSALTKSTADASKQNIMITDTLPALMNSIKMIHTIARYYNTNERMEAFDPQELGRKLEACLKLNEAYQEQYRLTKLKLEQAPKGKQFSFNEMAIFGKFDLFCRRVIKLVDLFSTIDQFNSLAENRKELDDMDHIIELFRTIVSNFRKKRHKLLDYNNNTFDRDYVEFNVKITDLEASLQAFINQSFDSISNIEHSLQLLKKFQSILQRESLKSDLDSKLNNIFQRYGQELELVQQQYEKDKHDPPIPRNLPPVAGNITWSRHLLKRIEEPMKQFESNQNVLAEPGSKRIIKMYNKVAKTLILQLIREAKCLDRMGIDVPDAARIVLFQEDKFKNYHNELHWALSEHDKVVHKVIPVTAMVLRPHFRDMEYKLRPGMITLTWTSMNIDSYKQHIHSGLRKLEELVANINDIIENRIEKNLKLVSKTLLVDLPESESFTVEEFVKMQEKHIAKQSTFLQGKNLEIEFAVRDLIKTISSYKLDGHVEEVAEEEIAKLKKHYNHFMYQALLHTAKNSMNALKKRIGSKPVISNSSSAGADDNSVLPFFEVDIQLEAPEVVLHPSLDEIQECINRSAQAILRCFKDVKDWSSEGGNPNRTFFDRITKDIEIVRVALLLTGCIQGIRHTVEEYLNSFTTYHWLWHDDQEKAYRLFMQDEPSLDDFDKKLKSFGDVDDQISETGDIQNIGALSLRTMSIKGSLKSECNRWKIKFSDNLHAQAKVKLEALTEFIRVTTGKVSRDVSDLDSLRFLMKLLVDVRDRESSMRMEIEPIMDMYRMLESYLPSGFMEKEETDKKTVLEGNWKKLLRQAEMRTEELSKTQTSYKRTLLKDIKDFKIDVAAFQDDFNRNGPTVDGIKPEDAVDRLNRFKEELKIRERKEESYQGGEELFALPITDYPNLKKTSQELGLADKLFGLYVDVLETESMWREIPWVDVASNITEMADKVENYATRMKKLPRKLKEFSAFTKLKDLIENFQIVIPLLQEFTKESIRDPCDLASHNDDIEEITDGADKQLKIENGLEEIEERWSTAFFIFKEWRGRGVNILQGTVAIMEELEETQMNLQAFLTMRHVAPFRELQMMWCSLESVFTGGDIAKQMPVEAKKFGKVDKEWAKIMSNATNTSLVVEASANDVLRAGLPVMYSELEKCQKSLEGYLEQKRNKFPRFYFVSNPGLLIILSQGSDPLSMNEHYEKVFDAISYVEHNRKDKTIIEKMHGDGGAMHEIIPFYTPVLARGNIEDWLVELRLKMQITMKDINRQCAGDLAIVAQNLSALEAIRGNKKSMPMYLGSSNNRKKIETLVTIHVHARDVTGELTVLAKNRKLTDPNDFDWLKQARFYWRPTATDSVSSDGACVISVTDVDFNYEFEYLGSKERLVVTPLTDRCYITLAQALGMFFGGAPAGPAGTGKTETVKDLGRTLGIFVVVTNCTDQQSYKDCAKIFKGLCMGGLWGCFDEFNRIRLPVLSVVAQQVLSILSAKKGGITTFQFPGDPQQVQLIACCSVFITMNPGYAGRQELPENLKALFRGVAMMVPDFQMIIKHYDWGLRNILAVLRTAGSTKRTNVDASESFLMYRTLREMNLSKMVAQDVPLFLSLLADLFPNLTPPPNADYPDMEAALKISKVLQLYDITLVRHGIMLVGPTGGGKSQIFKNLRAGLETVTSIAHKEVRLNPKSIRAQEMYGEMDLSSGEWTTGVFAAIWAKFNNRSNAFNTWIINDGPVDSIWIEDLNTVLDDNRILTLANGDRIPMTDNVKIMFEVETLVNASPATVSRAGIIYVSDTDLDWSPTLEAWILKQPANQMDHLRGFVQTYMGESKGCIDIGTDTALRMERIFVFCLAWTICGCLDVADRHKFDEWLRGVCKTEGVMPTCGPEETIYEYFTLDFSNLLVPTMDSTRASYNIFHMQKQKKAVCLRVNFSSATTPFMAQQSVEVELEKRGGKNFGPPGGRAMTIFVDDISMPDINVWGDQPTLEMVRLIVEYNGFYFLDKDKRGDFKQCEDLQFMGAMQIPGGGKNDIPNRLKRNFYIFNMVSPSIVSINDMYGQMLKGRFPKNTNADDTMQVVGKLTEGTISLWRTMQQKMLPTPAKFHYIFNLRELSRVFQGIMLTPSECMTTGGYLTLLRIWKHECERVFSDKLTNLKDKATYKGWMEAQILETFGEELSEMSQSPFYMVNFLRPDDAPKVYEPGGNLEEVRPIVMEFLERYNYENPSKKMELVLFNDALEHLLRINRLMEMPRGSGLLVGVGGSGKQSLVRLSSFISRCKNFQITLTKSYNKSAFLENMKELYTSTGHLLKSTTFLFTESEIKEEVFLEYINSMLLTGDIPGLFAKDEIMAITADLRNHFLRERVGEEDTQDNLKQYFIDKVRDNLHLMICMSPMNPKFPVRARKFPGFVSCPTIDWFLPWPADALVALSKAIISDFEIECTADVKEGLMTHMGMVHTMVTQVCDEYFTAMRRKVFQTPKSYLSFIQNFTKLYGSKLGALKDKESRVKLGLEKLIQGAKDVDDMKKILAEEQIKLEIATVDTNKMLASLEISSAEAKVESDKVQTIKEKCEGDAKRIGKEKTACMADLAKAQPFVDEAEVAIRSIKPADIGEVKKFAQPAMIIQLVFDGILLLFKLPMSTTKAATHVIAKKDTDFLAQVIEFGNSGKDVITEETIELLTAYTDLDVFIAPVAKNASSAAEGLCKWVRAMKDYHGASKVVKPKLEALMIAEGNLAAANKALAAAMTRLQACQARLDELQSMFDAQMGEKRRIEDGALALQRKMTMASQLINGLSGERVRWTEDANNFADMKRRLVGDCAASCAFVCYCGPFNQEYRQKLINDKFVADCQMRGVPITVGLDVIYFLVDIGTIGDWNMQGLPADPLSTQNGILVTQSSRYPLMIDPQGQALTWIKTKEASNVAAWGQLEEEIDPMLDPVLEKQIIKKGRRMQINVADKLMEYDPKFMFYFITRLPNPNFTPELQAKTNVIGKEQRALEDQLNSVLEEVNLNTKALMALDASLLERLTSNTGNLLEDEELVGVLANTKAKAAEVNIKLTAAADTKASIAEKREQFRPVATRGSVLYFAVVEMSGVNCMYQTALTQFLILITAGDLRSIDLALFLRGGAALDMDSVRRKPFSWISNEAWLNVIELSNTQKFFVNLPNDMVANEAMWRRWYEDNEPEALNIPEYEAKIAEVPTIGPFYKMMLVRSLRMDRVMLSSKWFVENIEAMGPRFVEPVTDTVESIYEQQTKDVPVIFLLSTGADPTDSIEGLARKRKLPPPLVMSMGEGQEEYAVKAMQDGAKNGTWVMLQNCELGLLQMSTKVTNEPPAGLKAGVLKSYTVIIDQERLERVDTVQWRQLLFALCFLHSIVQERRKFGPLGWAIPYEYNNGDLTACILFLEKHLYNGSISWPTFQYMVCEAQYGGKITDTLDRRLFRTYVSAWMNGATCSEGFAFNPKQSIYKFPNDFRYKVLTSEQIGPFHDEIKSFPSIDTPEIFGLHPNADLTFRVKEVTDLFNTLSDSQPKGGGGGDSGISREDVVFEKCDELLGRMPEHYFSWMLPTLGLWFASLLQRDDQYRTWLYSSRPYTYWLTGFFNPQGMLTAMKQEVCRKHQKDANKWALDDIVYHTEVTEKVSTESVKAQPAEGAFINGLWMEGAGWDRHGIQIQESEPKTLYVQLPILYCSANHKVEEARIRKDVYGTQGPYDCPCYKYRARTDRYFIFLVTLKCTPEKNPAFWTLRGVALLCNTD